MKKHLRLIVLVSYILTSLFLSAQNAELDSLINCLEKHTQENEEKVDLLNRIGYKIATVDDRVKTRLYATKASILAEKLNYQEGLAYSLRLIGASYKKSDVELTLQYYQRALDVIKTIGNKEKESECYRNIGDIYRRKGEVDKGFECYQQAMVIAEEINSVESIAKCLKAFALYYSNTGNYIEAIAYLERAVEILRNTDNIDTLASCLNNLGVIYFEKGRYSIALDYYQQSLKLEERMDSKMGMLIRYINIGEINIKQEDYELAEINLLKALKIAEEINDSMHKATCLNYLGDLYLATKNPAALEYYKKADDINSEPYSTKLALNSIMGMAEAYLLTNNYDQARSTYLQAGTLARKINRQQCISEVYLKLGTIDYAQRNYNEALDFALKSLKLANEMDIMEQKRDVNLLLSEIYAAISHYQKAYIHQGYYKQYYDSIYNKTNKKKILELEYAYKHEKETEALKAKQEHELSLQVAEKKQQTIVIIALAIGVLLLIVFLIYIIRALRSKHKSNRILTTQKQEIELLNDEYQMLNEKLMVSNEYLSETKLLLERNKERLRLIIKNSHDVFVLVNDKREQVFVSDAIQRISGFLPEELFKPIEYFVHPEDQERVLKSWQKVINNEISVDTIQYRHLHADGHYIWFETVAQNFLDNEAINAVVANVRDITERKQMEEKLSAVEEERARLMAQELERVKQELELNSLSMTASTLKLVQTAERDAKVIDQLSALEKEANVPVKASIKSLINEYKCLSNNSNWEEFDLLFQKTNSSFYSRLNELFPDLTRNERKICAFLKLNMSNKEIAQITFQSEAALKKARLRLRKKLDLSRDVNLQVFLQGLSEAKEYKYEIKEPDE